MAYRNWDHYENALDRGPAPILWAVFGLCLGAMIVVGGCGYVMGWFSEAATVAQQELGPRATLAKYQWFKDAAASLDKKRADIKVYGTRVASLKEGYGDAPRSKWTREDREQYNIWMSEVAGIKASYNSLASEYNAAMVKANWAYANIGELPPGATEPLPREFKPYIEE